jgi:hypothetical protein
VVVTAPRRVEIVIDHLVVHGLDRRAAALTEQALVEQLEDLSARWADGSLPVPAPGARERTRTSVTVTAGRGGHVPPDDLGRAVAGAVAGAVRHGAPASGLRQGPADPRGTA